MVTKQVSIAIFYRMQTGVSRLTGKWGFFAKAATVGACAAASLLLAHPVASETSSEFAIGLEGRVNDQDGEPLVGVIVSVFGDNLSGGARTAITDESGRFLVERVPPGMYNLRAYLAGFLPSASAQVIVREGVEHVGAVLMSLASLDGIDQAADGPNEPGTSASESAEPQERSVGELSWLLAHGDRNILKGEEWTFPVESLELAQLADGRYAPDFSLRGEFGVRAASYDQGLQLFPGAGAGLDGRLAYARLFIPTRSDGHWMVSAQVLETALSSWAGRAEYTTNDVAGHRLAAGVSYGNYLYGDLEDFRPPEAALTHRATGNRSIEWFGSAYASDSFNVGLATVEGSVSYEHFGFLQKAGYVAPRLNVSRPISADGRTLLVGGAGFNVLAPGGEDIDLLSQVAYSDVYGPSPASRSPLRAQRTARMHAGLERRVADSTRVMLRLFQEDVTDQLVKAYSKDRPHGIGAGYFRVSNRGQFRSRGAGLAVSQSFGAMEGSVGYTYGMVAAQQPTTRLLGAPESNDADKNIHDVTTQVATSIDRTQTRLQAAYRWISHPSFNPDAAGFAPGTSVDSRFNFQVFQVLPFVGWNGTSWELMVAVRNLFYEDLAGASLLDEIAVIDAPRRVLGGVTVRF